MKIKKLLISSIILLFLIVATYADSFTDILQDLAIQTACIGQYSATQAGGGWYDDPQDYYTPGMMAARFKNMSGNMTRTITFYGVCFDYAEFSYWDINDYQTLYNNEGMGESQFFLATVDSNSNEITLSSPSNRNEATQIQNGVYVKTYGSASFRDVKTHKKLNGERALHHAWLWIMRNDGVWFWINPTWTDNLGYAVYGYVANGEEIQLRPDEKYCINYPDYLKNLPAPPKWGKKLAPSTSTATSSTSAYYSSSIISFGYTGSFFNFIDIDFNKCGFEFSSELLADQGDIFGILSFDYLIDHSEEKTVDSFLVGFAWGYGLLSFFQPYLGGSLGMKSTRMKSTDKEKLGFAWKVNGGIRIPLSSFTVRTDISFGTILGLAGTVAVGMYF